MVNEIIFKNVCITGRTIRNRSTSVAIISHIFKLKLSFPKKDQDKIT